MIKEKDYLKMTKEEQDKHHAEVRDDLVKKGLIIPRKEREECNH